MTFYVRCGGKIPIGHISSQCIVLSDHLTILSGGIRPQKKIVQNTKVNMRLGEKIFGMK